MSQVKNPSKTSGAGYWRSLGQLADSPEIREIVAQEFPGYDADSMASASRRSFLKLAGAAMALAGVTLTGCRRWPKEELAPFSSNPVGRMPGVPEQYATAWEFGGVGHPLLVTSFDGRPIKIEGNGLHPMSVVTGSKYGASSAYSQASILELYDPLRNTGVIARATATQAKPATFPEFIESFRAAATASGSGFAILSESSSSPTVADVRSRFMRAFPGANWYEYEAISCDNELEGSRLAFGLAVRSRLFLDKADVVLCLDADPLGTHPAAVRYANDWAQRRKSAEQGTMSRVYSVESVFSTTGSVADVRLGVTPDRVYAIARVVAAKLGVAGVAADGLSAKEEQFAAAVAADLKKAGKTAVVSAGSHATPATHALAYAINQQLGSVGTTVTLHADPAGNRSTHVQAITELTTAMNAGKVSTLLIIGGNPVYDAPVDLNFPAALAKVATSAHLSLFDDETSQACKFHVPRAHYLESFGDVRTFDGSATIAQPLIEPLFGGKSTIEFLAMLGGDDVTEGRALVRRTYARTILNTANDDLEFRRAMERGVLPNSEFAAITPALKPVTYPAPDSARAQGTYAVRIDSNYSVYDGRFANNGWLQETPDPLSKLIWDNAALISKKDADALGVEHTGMLTIDAGNGHSIELPAFILPGQPIGVIGITLGFGRTAAGPIGNEVGFNTYILRTSGAMQVIPSAKVAKTGKYYTMATTQEHHILGSPDDPHATYAEDIRIGARNKAGTIVREAEFVTYNADKKVFKKEFGVPLELFQEPFVQTDTHAWGMSIDMNSCTGCGSCLLACVAENNIPVVGKDQSLRHREMNWIRIDRYFKGDIENSDVDVVYQPMMCQHCENAPCEQVCPVAATVHDSEGLNTMVYNRCIGTRYCSNNCPYKVRRFNYFDFHAQDPRSAWGKPWLALPDQQQDADIDKIKRMVYNPDVTVRMRGVMEKCTYCVQRIHGATIAKRGQGSDVVDGDIITACQQACPTQAIIFGNYNEPNSKINQLKETQRSYQVLADLNTRARTRYLAKLRNPADTALAENKEA